MSTKLSATFLPISQQRWAEAHPTNNQTRKENPMDTLLKIIIALSFSGAATLTIWLLVEAADAVLRHKRGKGYDEGWDV